MSRHKTMPLGTAEIEDFLMRNGFSYTSTKAHGAAPSLKVTVPTVREAGLGIMVDGPDLNVTGFSLAELEELLPRNVQHGLTKAVWA